MWRHTRKRDERGASAVEYGLLISGVAAMIAAVVFGLGEAVSDVLYESARWF